MIFVADSLTQFELIQHLRYANQIAAKKIASYIDKLKDGKRDEKLFDDAELLFNLIDSIKNVTPIGDMINGTHAKCSLTLLSGINVTVSSLSIGDIDYAQFYMQPSIDYTKSDVAIGIAKHINSLYPQNPYYAMVDNESIVVYGTKYADDNGTAVEINMSNSLAGSTFSGTMAGGIDGDEVQEKNCLSNEQLVLILNKITSLINC